MNFSVILGNNKLHVVSFCRCIIAMGLDKKPTPPKRVKEDPLLSTSLEEEVEEEDKPDPIKSLETQTDAKEGAAQDENKPKNGTNGLSSIIQVLLF